MELRRNYPILIVDDEWLIADTAAAELMDAGYEVAGPVGSVPGALQLLEREHVDAALLDVRLGNTDSFPIASDLAARNIPFAFVTGFSRIEIPEKYASRPLLSKPTSPARLTEAVAKLLAG